MTYSFSNTAKPGSWIKGNFSPLSESFSIRNALYSLKQPLVIVDYNGLPAAATGGSLVYDLSSEQKEPGCFCLESIPGKKHRVLAYAPVLCPENLGDAGFKIKHNISYAYVAGAMANAITSVDMVKAMAKAGMFGVFGSAGLSLKEVEKSILEIQQQLGNLSYGFNLIHSPGDPELESALVDLYLHYGIRRVCASAYLNLTQAIVCYRVTGIHEDSKGNIICPNIVMAKVSREEVARKFLSPPPEKFLMQLVDDKKITPQQADLARHIPMADCLTAEADSGGHTDNRPALSLLPTMIALRDEMTMTHSYEQTVHVGLGGGIGTPHAAAAAFAMGAAYVLTGSVNQACIEAGTSGSVRRLLSEAAQADVAMAPSADMFEMGVKVQVLKRGTMFAQRASKLYELFMAHKRLEEIPEKQRHILERDYFRCSLDEEWEKTKAFFSERDPRQIDRAEGDPRYKMALVFRSYLGKSSGWATTGDQSRKMDYQIWCGPSMGAFNAWVRGSFLEKPENRDTVTIAMNFLFGACILTRANWIRCQGVNLPQNTGSYSPLSLDEIVKYLQ